MRRHDVVVAAGAENNAAPPAAGEESPGEPAGAAASPFATAAGGGRTWPDRRIIALVGGAAGCVLIAVLFGLVRHRAAPPAPVAMAGTPSPSSPSTSAPTGAPAPTAAAAGGAPVAAPGTPDGRVEEARRLRHNGEWEQALAVLARARHESPQDADVDYLLADIYLEHHRPLEGLSSAQSAIRKNPALRSDGDLVNAVIDSLGSDKTYDRSQAFLRGLGSAATPFLKEAAHHHASAKVRQRAAEVLQSSGGGRSAFGSSAGSSSSLFRR
jgi:hypothetical protein